MKQPLHFTAWSVPMRLTVASLALLSGPVASAQTAYGVNNDGLLFRFDVTLPASSVTEIAEIGFIPEAIDFRPGTTTLYAIDVGPSTTQLYTIDLNTAVPTPVGAGFPSSGVGYDLTSAAAAQSFGFDFNPSTLQPDNSMRIRLVSSGGSNLRLHSGTGIIVGIDAALAYAVGDSNAGTTPRVDAVAYSNNLPNAGVNPTTLYDLEVTADDLATQEPPNAGQLNTVGPIGVFPDALLGASMDIHTDPVSLLDSAYVVLVRSDTPHSNYLLYRMNLGTGQITGGAFVGPDLNPYDFTGGFAMVPTVPEANPLMATLALVGSAFGLSYWRRRSAPARSVQAA